jgi:hypothetical protein
MFNPFAALQVLPKLLKRLASGEVIATGETTANFGQSRVRLTVKREIGAGGAYAVLSVISSNHNQHFHLSPQELDELANLARTMQTKVRENRSSDASGAPAALAAPKRRAIFGRAISPSPRPFGVGRHAAPSGAFKVGLLIAALLLLFVVGMLLRRPELLLKALG